MWLVLFAAEVLNHFKVRESGKTAFEAMACHKSTHAVVGFGEVVYFQHIATGKEEYRKDIGIYIGMNDRLRYIPGGHEGRSLRKPTCYAIAG